jgi:hypothetical protein
MDYEEPVMTTQTAQDLVDYHGLDSKRASELVGLTYQQAAVQIGKWLREAEKNL